jgi:hypothetical protein
MRKALTTMAVLTAVVLSSVAVASTPATAAPAKPATASAAISDSEYLRIVTAGAEQGRYTAAQLAGLATRPDISTQAPEVRTTTTVVATKAKWKSKKVDRYVKVKFSDGGSFRYHLWVSWSYNGKKILGKPSTGRYLTNTGIWQIRITGKAKVTNRWTRKNHYSLETIIVGKWKQCLAGICIASNGVQGQFGLYGNGHYTFTGKTVDV